MLLGLTILLAFWGLGVLASGWIPIPGSVLGMLFLALALRLGWVRRAWVEVVADGLLAHLPLFFVPAGVAVVLEADTLRAHGLAIGVASGVSLVLVLVGVGWAHRGRG